MDDAVVAAVKSMAVGTVSSMFLNETFSDVRFKVENRIYPAHRCIVKRLAYFDSKMRGMDKNETIELEGLRANEFETILGCMYGRAPGVEKFSFDEIATILKRALEFQFSELVQDCLNYVATRLPGENLEVFQAAVDHDVDPLRRMCIDSFDTLPYLLSSKEFMALSLEAVREMVSLDTLFVPEIEIFRAVKKWIEVDPPNRREPSGSIMKRLRLYRIPRKLLLDEVWKSGLVEADDIFQTIGRRNKLQAEMPDRGIARKFVNLSDRVKPCVTIYNQPDEVPSGMKKLTNLNKVMFIEIDLHFKFFVNAIYLKFRIRDPNAECKFKIYYSNDVVESKKYSKINWLEPEVKGQIENRLYLGLTFEPKIVKNIMIIASQDTIDKIFKFETIKCFYEDEHKEWTSYFNFAAPKNVFLF